VLRLRRNRRPPEQSDEAVDFGDGKSPARRRADARRAHYEHQRRLLEVKVLEQQMSSLHPGGLQKSAP
jgi:hypothetical protein